MSSDQDAPTPDDPNEADAARAEIRALRGELAALRTRVGQLESIKKGRVFLARADGEDGAWQEVIPGEDDDGNGVLKDFPGGRSTDSNALIDPVHDDGPVWPVLEYRAGGRFRFVRLFAGLAVVKLTLSDGENGDDDTAPTYTYDIRICGVVRAVDRRGELSQPLLKGVGDPAQPRARASRRQRLDVTRHGRHACRLHFVLVDDLSLGIEADAGVGFDLAERRLLVERAAAGGLLAERVGVGGDETRRQGWRRCSGDGRRLDGDETGGDRRQRHAPLFADGGQ